MGYSGRNALKSRNPCLQPDHLPDKLEAVGEGETCRVMERNKNQPCLPSSEQQGVSPRWGQEKVLFVQGMGGGGG